MAENIVTISLFNAETGKLEQEVKKHNTVGKQMQDIIRQHYMIAPYTSYTSNIWGEYCPDSCDVYLFDNKPGVDSSGYWCVLNNINSKTNIIAFCNGLDQNNPSEERDGQWRPGYSTWLPRGYKFVYEWGTPNGNGTMNSIGYFRTGYGAYMIGDQAVAIQNKIPFSQLQQRYIGYKKTSNDILLYFRNFNQPNNNANIDILSSNDINNQNGMSLVNTLSQDFTGIQDGHNYNGGDTSDWGKRAVAYANGNYFYATACDGGSGDPTYNPTVSIVKVAEGATPGAAKSIAYTRPDYFKQMSGLDIHHVAADDTNIYVLVYNSSNNGPGGIANLAPAGADYVDYTNAYINQNWGSYWGNQYPNGGILTDHSFIIVLDQATLSVQNVVELPHNIRYGRIDFFNYCPFSQSFFMGSRDSNIMHIPTPVIDNTSFAQAFWCNYIGGSIEHGNVSDWGGQHPDFVFDMNGVYTSRLYYTNNNYWGWNCAISGDPMRNYAMKQNQIFVMPKGNFYSYCELDSPIVKTDLQVMRLSYEIHY